MVVDLVGPLPHTERGKEYILKLICQSTRYPDAIPIPSPKSRVVVPFLVDVFSKFGIPREVQTDRGSNFIGDMFDQAMEKLEVKHIVSSVYHPQSQGCLERFRQTLKGINTKSCMLNRRDWDESIQVSRHVRHSYRSPLGSSPFELMLARNPREPLSILNEEWQDVGETRTIFEYVMNLRYRLQQVYAIAREHLGVAQEEMKKKYDKRAVRREFKPDDLVLLLKSSRQYPLQSRYQGPFALVKKVRTCNYVLSTPGRRKETQIVYISLLKAYDGEVLTVGMTGTEIKDLPEATPDKEDFSVERSDCHLSNSLLLTGLEGKLSHLAEA